MARNEIRYEVDVDSSDAQRGLRDFSRAAKDAGKEAARALDDTATAGDKARAAITEMAQAMDSELRDAATAADALKTALGESADKFDVNQIVADLNRMGVTFDEIKTDADQFAATLREVDGIRVQQTADGVDHVRSNLDETSDSARGANSALANMIGNTTQTLGGLGGIVGDIGVGIGQMGEYAADAALGGEKLGSVLKSMAAVAGPIGALALATAAVNKYLSEQQRIKAWRAEQVQGYKDAVAEVGVGLSAINQHLAETANAAFEAETGITDFLIGGQEIENVAAMFGAFGLNVRQVSRAIAAGASDTDEGKDAINELEQAITDAGFSLGDFSAPLDYVREQQDAYSEATRTSANENLFFAASMGDITGAMSANTVALGATEALWQRLLSDLRDGHIDTQKAQEAWNRLRDELDLTNEAMAELTQQKLDEQMQADADAGAALADTFLEMADTAKRAADAQKDFNRITSSADYGKTSVEAAQTALTSYFDDFFAAGDQLADQEVAYENLGEAITGAADAGLSWHDTLFSIDSAEGRNVRQALRQLGDTLIPGIQEAYDNAGGDQEQFRKNMAVLGERTLVRLENELGISRDQANALAQQLGLVPGNVDTIYQLIGTEDAKLKLGLMQTAIDNLPEDVQTTVTQKILLGDYQGALAVVQNYYNVHGATIPVDADVSLALQAVRNFAAAVRGMLIAARIAANISVSTSGTRSAGTTAVPAGVSAASAGLYSTAAPASALTALPSATAPQPVVVNVSPPPPSVTVNTGLVGSRYGVERAVARALRSYTRLNGRRRVTLR